LSVDGLHASVTLVVVAPACATFAGADGAVVSGTGQAAVEALIEVRADRFPAAS
jgi:hypothetical protein